MKKIKIFINSNFSKNSIQAQDRDGKHYAYFLNSEKYEVYGFSTDGDVEEFIKEKKHIKYFISSNKIALFFKKIFCVIFNRIDVFFTGKAFWQELIYFKINKVINRGKNILVLVNQTPYLWFKFDLKIFRHVVSSSHKIIAISRKVAYTFEKEFKIKTKIIPLFYKIIDNKNKEFNLNKRKKIVCVGSMISQKRPFVFADLAKSLPQYDFIWIGKGYYYSWIIDKIEKEKIKNLKVIPKLLQSELFNFISSCDLFYFPSIHEGFPNVLVESLNCGVPVVCYNSFGPDAVIDNYNGIVLDNIFSSKIKISEILENETRLNELKFNAIKSAQKYNGENLTDDLDILIESLFK